MMASRIILFLLMSFQVSCSMQPPDIKINGVSLVASHDAARQEHMDPLRNLNANYAAVMPFGFIRDTEQPELVYNIERQWFGETSEGVAQYISLLHSNDIEVMLKPQIWIWHGNYTGHLKMETEVAWKALETDYRNFILEFARVAAEKKVAMLCIGTELEAFIAHRPEYWTKLIREIRTIYKGKLTYAANWDAYARVPFWDQLDYIGIDAYFPVAVSETPSLEEAKEGWQPWKTELSRFARTQRRQVLFTEVGYRSVNYAGREPWRSDRDTTHTNLDAQYSLTRALHEEVWDEPWFAGGFLWKWFLAHEQSGGPDNNRFTPQQKPAEALWKEAFRNSN